MFRAHLPPAPVDARAPMIDTCPSLLESLGRVPRYHRPSGSSSPRQESCEGHRGSDGDTKPPPARSTRARSESTSTSCTRACHRFHCVNQSVLAWAASGEGTPAQDPWSHSRPARSPRTDRTTRAAGSAGSEMADHQAPSQMSSSVVMIVSIPQLLRCNDVVNCRVRGTVQISERPCQPKHSVDAPH